MVSSPTPLLEIRDLAVNFAVYGGELRVLDGVNFRMFAGERVGLVGETGCGKTTMMKAILRVLPTPPACIPRGEILFKGKDILKMKERELRSVRGTGISMIFQDPTAALNPVFTIGAQMHAVIQSQAQNNHRSIDRRKIWQLAVSALKDVALADPERLLKSYPIQLSGGMRQRVCIAMALSTNPEILIADEPGTSLDVTIQDQILRLLRDLVEKRNMSVILITHTLGVVRELTNRVYVMYAGSIVETAETTKIFSQPLHPYTRGLIATVPRLTGGGIASGIPGRIPDYRNPPIGCRFHPRCPHVMEICKQQKPPLIEVEPNHSVACFLYSPTPKVEL
ncbi:MAG: ABC transporter ATP-binding protein [Anaerolineales bacterium]|nr:ABC transporter ATP-binding protein [Anaerolineales bacterium]MDW8446345.1 ABC transporter ATP-binding protein [Anaerolineales bacterium]